MKFETEILNSLPLITACTCNLMSYSVTITFGIQSTNVVTITMKVLHNSCNMCTLDMTDMYALFLGPHD